MIIRSKAPLRLGLAGGGTDVSPYCDIYGGTVLNVTIDMYTYCSIEPASNGFVEFYAADRGESVRLPSESRLPTEGPLPLHLGTYNRVVHDYCGGKPLSLKMTTYSDAPAGSGLGSSSTMVVAMLKAYMEWLNLPLGEYDMADLAYQIERVDLGLSGGKQDQYAATFGGLNYMEFMPSGQVIVNPLRIKRWIKNELESSLLLYYTGTSRDSARIIEEQVRCQKDETSLEGMHALKREATRMKECVLKGEFDGFADCLRRGWEAKKQTSAMISNPLIEERYRLAMDHGGKAAKISGAGGGGFMMILCDPKRRFELMERLKQTDGRVMVCSFTELGTQAWTLYERRSALCGRPQA